MCLMINITVCAIFLVLQYLHMRFESQCVDMIAAVLQLASLTLMNAVVLFGPCVMMESGM